MKSLLPFVALLVAGLQCVSAAETAKFFAARGKYRLSATTTLIISEQEQTQQYTLKSKVRQNNTDTSVSRSGELSGRGEAFLVYWDADSQTLWWATHRRLGYCDIHNPQSARSSAHDRATPIREYDKFPSRPPVFVSEIERVLPIQP